MPNISAIVVKILTDFLESGIPTSISASLERYVFLSLSDGDF